MRRRSSCTFQIVNHATLQLAFAVVAVLGSSRPCAAGHRSWLRVLQENSEAHSAGGNASSGSHASVELTSSGGAQGNDTTHSFMLSSAQRARGLTYIGSAERLRLALDRALKRKRLTVTAIGGSITAGAGAVDSPRDAWVDRLQTWLVEMYGGAHGVNVTVNNGAVPGTTSAYMCACFRRHVPQDVDVVFIEYAVNDEHRKEPIFDNNARKPMERLVRKLLLLPSRPAIVLLNTFAWFNTQPFEGVFWSSAEREFQELAWYYHLPTVSVKAACYADMVAAKEGYSVHAPRLRDLQELKGKAFYYDPIHPDGNTGHRVMAELAMHLVATVARDLKTNPINSADDDGAAAPLPRPMIRDNHASTHDTCFVGPHFRDDCVGLHEGWEWVNEAKGPRPKWGYVAKEVGKVIQLRLNTLVSASTPYKPVLVQLAHLRSYEHMGWAEVTCASNCSCPPTRFNGHTADKTSLLGLHKAYVTQHEACVLEVKVLEETASGEHKVKLAGAIVSDQAGEQQAYPYNAETLEYVHDISLNPGGWGSEGVFDARNHI